MNDADQGKCTAAVYMDSKQLLTQLIIIALSKKHPHFGICNTELEWLTDYLFIGSNRSRLMDIYLILNPLPCGIPQGSILGP